MIFAALCSIVVAFAAFLPSAIAAPGFPINADRDVSAGHHISQSQISQFLSAHNVVRAKHDAVPLKWDTSLASNAAEWANKCIFKHSGGSLRDTLYGENIAAATGAFPIPTAVGLFSEDESEYDPSSPTYNHFTQVVWKNTTLLGCAVSKCNDLFDPDFGAATLYVCLYDPAGNVVGEALDNVEV